MVHSCVKYIIYNVLIYKMRYLTLAQVHCLTPSPQEITFYVIAVGFYELWCKDTDSISNMQIKKAQIYKNVTKQALRGTK